MKEQFLQGLQKVQQKIFRHPFDLVLSCDQTQVERLEKESFYGLGHSLATHHVGPWKEHEHKPHKISSQARLISSPVAFTAEAFQAVEYLHPSAPAITIASFLLENKILHHRIRELGGAYGCGASYNSLSGQFYFFSYRDQYIARTVKIFRDSLVEMTQGNFSEEDLEEAKLGVIQQLDQPISPSSRALSSYLQLKSGKTPAMRNHFREKLLKTSPKDIIETVQNQLLNAHTDATLVTFASKELIEKEQPLFEPQKHLDILSI